MTRWLRWLLVGILVALGVVLVARDVTPFRQLASLNPLVVLALALLVVVNQGLLSLRFKLVMSGFGAELTRWGWFRVTVTSQYLNLFVPQSGNVHRAVVLRRASGLPYARYASGLIVFSWIELLTSALLACCVVLAVEASFSLGHVPVILPLVACLICVASVPTLLRLILDRLPVHAARGRRVVARLQPWIGPLAQAQGNMRLLGAFSMLNVTVAVTHLASLSLAFSAVGADPSWGHLAMFQVLLKLTNQVMLTPGNLGLTELAYGVLAHGSSVAVQQGIAAAVLMRTVGTGALVLLGWVVVGSAALMERQGRAAY